MQVESQAILDTADALDESFAQVVESIQAVVDKEGKLILAGLGKNSGICQKLVGTFNSIGVSSSFLDPVQAVHGDLGMCQAEDLAIVFSNSGETREVIELIPLLRRLGVQTVAVTSEKTSSLGTVCDLVLSYVANEEACPLNLAPTASTTASLALIDAVAMVFLDQGHFSKEDFAKFHPSGSLGASLLLKVDEIMRSGERFASIPVGSTVQETIVEMTRAKAGSISILEKSGQLAGIFTDADLRRAILKDTEVFPKLIDDYMTRQPIVISSGALVADALKAFEENKIDDLLVVDRNNKPVGVIDGQDLPKLRIV
ncbi:KpsF/GutQ family sugar-phosphate isomerase [Opitutia bacterium ISCC 51]|nr:KpsF/GutQ family sugar-phosphate isomerase [Opitutae bacterium ISCC 51]QXD27833.1 KpsF/GutQ family sugar-phosphate isomerase [Opitutae bacterium ISCC 52]